MSNCHWFACRKGREYPEAATALKDENKYIFLPLESHRHLSCRSSQFGAEQRIAFAHRHCETVQQQKGANI